MTPTEGASERAIALVRARIPHFSRSRAIGYIQDLARCNLICLDCGSENHTRGHSFCSGPAVPPTEGEIHA